MLFENHYERTSEVMKELFGAIYFKRPLTVIIYLALGVIAAISVAEMIGSGVFHLGGWVYLVIFALMQLVMYNNSVKNAIAKDREKFGGDVLKVHTAVTEEGIQCTYGEKTVDPIPMSQIKKVYKTKNLILLHTDGRLLMIFHKSNFTVGTEEEFVQHLREQGLKV